MIAPAFPRKRKPRARAPLQFEVVTRYELIPVAEFARRWAPLVAIAAARVLAESTATQGTP